MIGHVGVSRIGHAGVVPVHDGVADSLIAGQLVMASETMIGGPAAATYRDSQHQYFHPAGIYNHWPGWDDLVGTSCIFRRICFDW